MPIKKIAVKGLPSLIFTVIAIFILVAVSLVNFSQNLFAGDQTVKITKIHEMNFIDLDGVPDTRFFLPHNPKDIDIYWVFPPNKKITALIGEKKIKRIKFEIDNVGNPIFGADNYSFLSSKWNYVPYILAGYHDFIWSDDIFKGKGLLTITEFKKQPVISRPVMLTKNIKKNELSSLSLKILNGLQDGIWSIFKGDNAYYFLNKAGDEQKVYFAYKSNNEDGFDFKYIYHYSDDDLITSVTGDESVIYVARNNEKGGFITKLPWNKKKKKCDYDKSNIVFGKLDVIEAIAYSKEAGMFYATDKAVGYIGNRNAIEFLETPNAQIKIQNNNLYIYLGNVCGVIKISDINNFKKYFGKFNPEKTIAETVSIDDLKKYGKK